MLFRFALTSLSLCLAACGGGGGGGDPPVQPTAPLRVTIDATEIGTASSEAELVVRLAALPAPAPALVQFALELPPQLALPASNRLTAVAGVPDLDGDVVDGRFVVLCGDAQNRTALPLAAGALCRVKVQTASPRSAGTWTVRCVDLRGATADGTACAVDAAAVTTTVTVR